MKKREGSLSIWRMLAQTCGFLAAQPSQEPCLALKEGERAEGTKEQLESKFHEGLFQILNILSGDAARFDSEESCHREAEELMAIETPFLGMETLKRACALTLFKDEEFGFLDRLEASGAHPYDREVARLGGEAIRTLDDFNASFTVTDAVSGAVADSLNMIIQSESYMRVKAERRARREKAELAEVLLPTQAMVSERGRRAPAI